MSFAMLKTRNKGVGGVQKDCGKVLEHERLYMTLELIMGALLHPVICDIQPRLEPRGYHYT